MGATHPKGTWGSPGAEADTAISSRGRSYNGNVWSETSFLSFVPLKHAASRTGHTPPLAVPSASLRTQARGKDPRGLL